MFKPMNFIKKFRSQSHLGSYIISFEPLILTSYWLDFKNNIETILKVLPNKRKVYYVFMSGWWKSDADAKEIKKNIETIQLRKPNIEFIFLSNSEEENTSFANAGLESIFCNQNCFLDENKYKIYPRKRKKYEAIYLARISPFKRQELAAKIDPLLFVGAYYESEIEYVDKAIEKVKPAKWIKKIPHFLVSWYINQAKCGLALSPREGAMFVSTEYLLSGLPQVSTKSVGGRDVYFSDDYVKIADDNPTSVLEAVKEINSRGIDPNYIRNQTIKIQKKHRDKFINLIQNIYNKEGCTRKFSEEWNKIFQHKLGLRLHVSHKTYKSRMLKKDMQL